MRIISLPIIWYSIVLCVENRLFSLLLLSFVVTLAASLSLSVAFALLPVCARAVRLWNFYCHSITSHVSCECIEIYIFCYCWCFIVCVAARACVRQTIFLVCFMAWSSTKQWRVWNTHVAVTPVRIYVILRSLHVVVRAFSKKPRDVASWLFRRYVYILRTCALKYPWKYRNKFKTKQKFIKLFKCFWHVFGRIRFWIITSVFFLLVTESNYHIWSNDKCQPEKRLLIVQYSWKFKTTPQIQCCWPSQAR